MSTVARDDFLKAVKFPGDVIGALSPHAQKRGLHVNELCRMIVEAAVDSNIVDAVLDDADVCYVDKRSQPCLP